jgi:hypothetical protein
MHADVFLDEGVAPDEYANGNDGRQQHRQSAQEVGFEASCHRHIPKDGPFKLSIQLHLRTEGAKKSQLTLRSTG